MKKLLISLFIFIFIAAQTMPVTVAASTAPDLNAPRSLIVEMKYKNTPLANMNITIYHVADMKSTGGTWYYELTDAFADTEAAVNEIATAEANLKLSESLYKYAGTNEISGRTAATNTSGQASFSNVAAGLFLVVPGHAEGFNDVEPYLVSVPGTGSDNEWVYTVTAQPKTEPEPSPSPSPVPVTSPSPIPSPSPSPTTSEPPETSSPPETEPPETSEPPEESPSPVPFPTPTPPTPSEPPAPTTPGNTLVPDGEVFIEIDEDGTPLGEWRQDEDGTWIFDEYVPLSGLPQTGMLRWPVQAMAGSGILLFAAGWIVLKSNKEDEKA